MGLAQIVIDTEKIKDEMKLKIDKHINEYLYSNPSKLKRLIKQEEDVAKQKIALLR